ncbi:uncharacterized protein MKK02DRAFT_41039 [Dioszegia hungarica]|uniref:NAD(P)-binding protein n=1 Tax=Dioszegia hungarica TaxID=4972 RepID=A0AA38LSM6_9TREE|nr:uncharacterized protein MKK02DRAFT_41039 [Dioszegia hungarica]KAI9632729.1 hypothetical protein MKK02DRAFT_41039 [Dioszegia hungarica]
MPYTVLITGANKGIGYEAVKLLAQKKPDAIILLGSRSTKNGEDAIAKMKSSAPSHDFSNVKVLPIDITSSSSLFSAAEHVKSTYTTLDALIHNSGISELDGDGKHPAIFDVNVRGAKDCVATFAPILTPKTGIITVVSSEVGAWYTATVDPSTKAKLEDIEGVSWEKVEGWMKDWEAMADGKEAKEKWVPLDKGMIGSKYCASKGILNPWLRKYAATHLEVRFAVVCPGYCATELNHFQGPRPASAGGESIIWPVLNEFESGKFYQDGKEMAFAQELPDWAK